ncbi:hypothetical protein HK405_012483, partial [Cladochytrium tenue]
MAGAPETMAGLAQQALLRAPTSESLEQQNQPAPATVAAAAVPTLSVSVGVSALAHPPPPSSSSSSSSSSVAHTRWPSLHPRHNHHQDQQDQRHSEESSHHSHHSHGRPHFQAGTAISGLFKASAFTSFLHRPAHAETSPISPNDLNAIDDGDSEDDDESPFFLIPFDDGLEVTPPRR